MFQHSTKYMELYIIWPMARGDKNHVHLRLGTGLLCLFFHLLCYAAVLKNLTYYAQYYAHVKELCLKSDCSIGVYSLVFKMVHECSIKVYQVHNKYGKCSIRVITCMVSVLLEYIDLH